jgi:hypothetical protein
MANFLFNQYDDVEIPLNKHPELSRQSYDKLWNTKT